MYYIINTSTDCNKTAENIATSILKYKYSSCVHIMPNIKSLFYWRNKINQSIEYKIEIKCNNKFIDKIVGIIKNLHNYDIPEITMNELNIINKDYEDWFNSNLREG